MRYFTPLLFLFCLFVCSRSLAQVSVTATGGTLGPTTYTNFTTAFAAINNGTHTGGISVSVTGNFSESVTPVLNSSGTGATSYSSVLIKPAAGISPTITNTADNTASIKLDGADNVTIDGSNTTGGTTRDMTFVNTNTSGSGNAVNIWLASKPSDGATNNVIKNCRVMGSGNPLGAAYMGVCICSSNTTMAAFGSAGSATVSANSNNTIQNNLMNGANVGVVFSGGAAVGETGNQIIGNTIGDNTSAANLKFTNAGIYLLNQAGFTIAQNTVTWVGTGLFTSIPLGAISIGAGCTGGSIRRNNITNIRVSQTTGLTAGILLNAAAGNNIKVENNFISDVASAGSATAVNNAYGIAIGAGSGYNIAFNSINMNTNPTTTATGYQAALYVAAGISTLNIRNNLFVHTGTNTTNKFSIYAATTNPATSVIDYNIYYTTASVLGYANGNQTALADIHTNFQNNLNHSQNLLPVFVSASDLHLNATNTTNLASIAGAGTAITGTTVDYDGNIRAAAPTIGAHELASGPCVPPAAPTTTAVSRCGPGPVTLTATSPAGTTLNWYTTATSTPMLASGATYTAPTVTGNTTYYVAAATAANCESPRVPVNIVVNAKPTAGISPAAPAAICSGASLTLTATGGNSYQWLNAAGSITGQTNAVYAATTSGIYRAVVYAPVTGCTDTSAPVTVTVNPTPVVFLGADTTFCSGPSLVLDAGNPGGSYLWNNAGTSQTRTVNTTGIYAVKVSNSNATCFAYDTITVVVNATPVINLGNDTTLCAGAGYTMNAGNPGSTYLWNNATTAQNRTVTTTGTYSVKVTSPLNCSASDTVAVSFLAAPVVDLGNDLEICTSTAVILDAGNPGASFLWDDGSTAQTRSVNSSGTYYVTVSNIAANCKGTDTVHAAVYPNPVVDLGNDTISCHNAITILDAQNPGASYLWDDGSTAQTRTVTVTGVYSVTVTDIHSCVGADDVTIEVKGLPGGDINAVYGDTATYTFSLLNARYVTGATWNFGDGSPVATGATVQHRYASNGIYTVTVNLLGECSDSSASSATVNVFDANGGTGLVHIENSNSFSLYPNPARNQVMITNKTGLQMKRLTVYNILGQVIYEAQAENAYGHRINTTNCTPGVYLLKIETESGFYIRKFEVMQ